MVGPVFHELRKNFPDLDTPRLVHEAVRRLINAMVTDLVTETRNRIERHDPRSVEEVRGLGEPIAAFSAHMQDNDRCLKDFMFTNMYRHFRLNRMASKATVPRLRRTVTKATGRPRRLTTVKMTGTAKTATGRLRLRVMVKMTGTAKTAIDPRLLREAAKARVKTMTTATVAPPVPRHHVAAKAAEAPAVADGREYHRAQRGARGCWAPWAPPHAAQGAPVSRRPGAKQQTHLVVLKGDAP